MADCGFNIAETLGTFGAKSEIPSFAKGQRQLWLEEVEDTRTIANAQIHVEHVTGNLQKKVFDTQWDYSNWFFDKK